MDHENSDDDAAEDEHTRMEHNIYLKKIDTLDANIEMLTQSGKYFIIIFLMCLTYFLYIHRVHFNVANIEMFTQSGK